MPKTVYIRADSGSALYRQMLEKAGYNVVGKLSSAVDAVLFTGGPDVNPSLYEEKRHPSAFVLQFRDMQDEADHEYALFHGIPMVGICRGGQFLNVKSGGRMWQDVDGHTGRHVMEVMSTGECITVTSTHHQMMIPGPEATIIATANEATFYSYMDGDTPSRTNATGQDAEVLYYPDTQCLCFQPHPEIMKEGERCRTFFLELLHELLTKNTIES